MPQTPQQEIERLTALMGSERDPAGRAFATLADACRRGAELDRAAALVSEGTEQHPDFASGWVAAGRVFTELERDDDARMAYERALELDEENVLVVLELAALAEKRDDMEGALEIYRQARTLDHTDPQVAARIDLLESLPPEAAGGPMVAADLEVEPPEEVPAPGAAPEPSEEIVSVDALAPDEPEVPEPELLEPDPMTVVEPQTAVPGAEPAVPEIEPTVPKAEDAVEEIVSIDALAPEPELEEPEAAIEHGLALEPELASETAETEPPEGPLEGEMLTRSMAEVLLRQGLTDAAIDVYEKLVARDPEDPELRARLAELKGEPVEAAPSAQTTSDAGASGGGGPATDEIVSIDSLAPEN